MAKYSLNDNGEFVIENYNQAKPFASFFPGIAGEDGIPMWVFYVNRGQCLCSIGLEDKQKPIMEFLSANAAYQLTSTQGFRTFIKIIDGKKEIFYEPFQDKFQSRPMKLNQKMIIRPESLAIEEENKTLGLCFRVEYFNIVRENYAGLVRKLAIKNITGKKIKFEALDGLPLIIPFGVDNYNLKNMRRLVESFVEAVNLDNKVPYFKIRTKQQDSPEVIRVKEGNFYIGFTGDKKIVSPIVDPEKIFDNITDYGYPKLFTAQTPYKPKGTQITENRLPCAMGYFTATIGPEKTCEYNSIIGSISSVEKLNKLIGRMCKNAYIERKQSENRAVIEQLTQNNFVQSNSNEFDLYCRQNFLDNVLRGGFPVTLAHKDKSTTLHLYSRKHGDLERDYNDFQLSPTNYSQGNGNFRDVNQNRRNDLLFNPDLKTDNIEQFYNMIQLDGFNPLIVKPVCFEIINKQKLNKIIKQAVPSKHQACVLQLFKKDYTPGQIAKYLAENNIKTKTAMPVLLAQVLAISKKVSLPDLGHGFWSDHWCYNLDLLENYLAVWPENLKYILFEKNDFTFFDNPHYVLPREDKYVLWCGKPMQIDSVVRSSEKEKLINQRSERKNEVRTGFGKGKIYHTTLAHKIISIIVNKIASLDFEGIGIEMESDKPNWYDALNGLPGLFGSSLCETLELKRLVLFMSDAIEKSDIKKISIANETYNFVSKIKKLLKTHKNDFDYWNKSASCKEEYRTETFFGISGKEKTISIFELKQFLTSALDKLNRGIAKAQAESKKGVLPSYFINQPLEYKKIIINGEPKLNRRGFQCIKIKKFKQRSLPSFLEGPVHFLRIEKDKNKAQALAKAVRKSGLFDKKLKMYKVNEPLLEEPMEIGRTKTFSRGWLENESIWTHMEYKYMLELLRSGLFEQFYADLKNVFVPFMNPQIYGRSILENSSFIAASANPDTNIHGTGFVARLSGSTAEFIHIFLIMAVGEKPFSLCDNNKLALSFRPAIPNWLFTAKPQTKSLWINGKSEKHIFAAKTFSFMFLGDILVTYKNPKMQNTFGAGAVKPVAAEIKDINGRTEKIKGGVFNETIARKAREHKIKSIEIELG